MTASPAPVDALIIGGGHNGLTCACYLAAAGLSVHVLERRSVLGGAAVTEEFFPGFRNSALSYTVSLLNPKVIRELRLAEHGLRVLERPLANFLPLSASSYLKMGGGLAATQAEVAKFSPRDAEQLPRYYEMLERIADVLREIVLETPPNVGGGFSEMLRALATGNRVRRLSMPQRRDLLDLVAKSAGDMLDAWFESDALKAALGFDAVVGHYASPYTPGSGYVLLHHCFGEVNGRRGVWGHAVGGMGAITQAMATEARARGVTLSTDAGVAKVLVRSGRATGVVLTDGRELSARCVIANVNPKLLYRDLIEPAALDAEFLHRVAGHRNGSGTIRINVALSELPDFTCLPGREAALHHQSGIICAPSLAYMERAFFDARASGLAREPIVEILVPSTVDDSLAPAGRHVASLFCQQFAPQLPDGRSWDDAKDDAVQRIFACVDRFAPNFSASVLGYKANTPLDLERDYGLIGGDIFHGALTPDQLYSARPFLGYADYRTPIHGLYLCGSGAHPGGGVTGAPGHNAAREVIRDVRRRRIPS
jgi:phytoene dehydrogenase-like protein